MATQAAAQVIDPQIMDLESFGAEYLPTIREFNQITDATSIAIRVIKSPYLTQTLTITEESDLTKITYGNSFAKAILINAGKPRLTIEIRRYHRFSITWLNEELLHVSNWPSRCVELHTIFSTEEDRAVYEQGFNHCGV